MALLNIQQLQVRFRTADGSFTAVKGIDLHMERGEILGLIGESGSGKSVASQSITRLIKQAIVSGKCLFEYGDSEVDLISANDALLHEIRRHAISYIFQEPMTALNPLIRCGQQIAECLRNHVAEKKQLESLLEKVELTDPQRILAAYPHELSGGQRQRVMIAMALAKSPDLLIADEPTTALDIAVQSEILQLLKQLAHSEQLAILFITHDLLSLKGFADRIAVMYQGSLVETQEAEQLLNQPRHPYTRALIESRASYDKKGMQLAEISSLLKSQDGTLHYQAHHSHQIQGIVPTQEELISLTAVYKWHEKKSWFKTTRTEVLKGIDLCLYRGDSLGLIGESGSGKSTIAKLILRIWDESKGRIQVKGQDLKKVRDLHEEIQLVFQDPYSSLNPKHKIGKAILEVRKSIDPKATTSEVEELLLLVGLRASDYNKYPHEFSGGQRQRICIAKALAKDPEILVLDEAVSALDVSVQAKILNLLNELKVKKGLTYLLISHDMNVVSYFCNRIMVIRHGEVQEYGETDELINSPKSAYTRSLLEHSIY